MCVRPSFNGFKNRVNELQTVLHNRHIDIVLVAETHLTQQSYVHI